MNSTARAFFAGLKPAPNLTVSEWADKYRIIPQGEAEPGKWKTSRTPYAKRPMDCLSAVSRVKRVILMWPTQLSKTEIGINWGGYTGHINPQRLRIVQPTVEMANDYSKQRLTPTINASPELKKRIKDSVSRTGENTIKLKNFPGGFIDLGGANSAATLSSKPVACYNADEVDRWPLDCDGEGPPLGLLDKRISNFPNSKALITSTPVDELTSVINREYKLSSMERYFVPCPDCKGKQVLKWEQLKFKYTKDYELEAGSVYYECEHCQAQISEFKKTEMLEGGEWIADRPDIEDVVGFWLNGLYAPLGWISWADIIKEFLTAKKEKNPLLLKQWLNCRMAEVWKVEGKQVEHSYLYQRREDYEKVPNDVAVLVCGVDTQDNRLELTVYGFGRNEECWGIVHEIIMGDPGIKYDPTRSINTIWNKLERFLDSTFQNNAGAQLPIYTTCIDTQGHHMEEVADFLKAVKYRKFKIKGINGSGQAKQFIKPPSKENKYNVELYTIGVSFAKEVLYYRLQIEEFGNGYIHYNKSFGEAFFKQLTIEKLIEKRVNGVLKNVWSKPDGARNEPLDTFVYAYAALKILDPDIGAFLAWVQSGCSMVGASKGGRKVRSKGVK